MDTLGERVGEEIRAMLARKRMSGSALARALDLPQTYVARRLDGRAAFTPAEVQRVAAVLGVSVAELLPREAHEVRPDAPAIDFATLDLNTLEKVAAALGVTAASLMALREQAVAGAGGSGPPPRYRPEVPDGDGDQNSTYFSSVAGRTGRPSRRAVTAMDSRSDDHTRPPSGPRAKQDGRTGAPAPRRPRVSARLAGVRP